MNPASQGSHNWKAGMGKSATHETSILHHTMDSQSIAEVDAWTRLFCSIGTDTPWKPPRHPDEPIPEKLKKNGDFEARPHMATQCSAEQTPVSENRREFRPCRWLFTTVHRPRSTQQSDRPLPNYAFVMYQPMHLLTFRPLRTQRLYGSVSFVEVHDPPAEKHGHAPG